MFSFVIWETGVVSFLDICKTKQKNAQKTHTKCKRRANNVFVAKYKLSSKCCSKTIFGHKFFHFFEFAC